MKIDADSMLAQVRANLAKLKGCPRHLFHAPAEFKLGMRVECDLCKGVMPLRDIGTYIEGYEAAGKSANDIWPGWDKDPVKNSVENKSK